MKIKLFIIGKTKSEFLIAGENEYQNYIKDFYLVTFIKLGLVPTQISFFSL